MSDFLTKELLDKILISVVCELEKQKDELNRLDSATGDGDHGTSILKAMRAASKATKTERSFKDTLSEIAWTIENADCGSTSTLLGSFFQGLSEAVTGEEVTPGDVIEMFVSGLNCVVQSTKARMGDKTLMDALIPAMDIMKSKRDSDVTLKALLTEAADSARFGAESTRDCIAKFGRAKNLGERTRGHLDPGACSMATVFEVFAKEIEQE